MKLFKPNITFQENEISLMRLIPLGDSIKWVHDYFPEFKDEIDNILEQIMSKMIYKDIGILESYFFDYLKIVKEKFKLVRLKRYKEVAELRNIEKEKYSEIYMLMKGTLFGHVNKSYINERLQEFQTILILNKLSISENLVISLFINPGTAKPKQIANLLTELSTLYRLMGGSGITFKLDETRHPLNVEV